MNSLDVIGFGALNVDKLFKVNKIAREEEESSIIDFKEVCGGSAANTIVGLARLELRTGYVGKVASDLEGKLLMHNFIEEGVNTKGIVISKKGRSGVVMGFIDEQGQRALYVSPGVNNSLEFEDIDLEYVNCVEFLHLTSFSGEKPFKAQKRLVQVLSRDVRISFDPGYLYAKMGSTLLGPLIKRCFVLFPNEIEVALLTGKGYEKGAEILIEKGAGIVAVKLGGNGCYITDGVKTHLIEPYKIKVEDTTGAGDAFCAGFLYGLIKNKDLYTCGKIANFVASQCIRKTGARTSLPRLSDLRTVFAS